MNKQQRSSIEVMKSLPFIVVHLMPLAALYTGATLFDWILCICLYFVGMFFVTAGYHRYFSHRSFKTSRVFQFILAFMAQTSAQKGVLWWASTHRVHHKHSDQPEDPHSMKLYGFLYSHLGWILGSDFEKTNLDGIKDFARYPELRWINKYHLIPPILFGVFIAALGGLVNGGSVNTMFTHGLSTLFISFFLSRVVLYHGTFSVNSLMHRFGTPRYNTGDESKNCWWLALLCMGEGWHNNHHYYQSATRQGFFWWEIDCTYYILKMLSFFGIVWGIREVPHHVQYSEKKTLKPT